MVIVVKNKGFLKLGGKKVSKLYWGDLDGRTWTRWSVSVWDIVKTAEERSYGHPAMFPVELCERLIRVYTRVGDVVLDPFMGSGSTLVATVKLWRKGVGFEIYEHFVQLAVERLNRVKPVIPVGSKPEDFAGVDVEPVVVLDDARNLDKYLDENTVDMVLTSPPYFRVHRRERTSDRKEPRPYGEDPRDLGNIQDYRVFLEELGKVFEKVYRVLRDGGTLVVVVMDVREGPVLYPLHIDLHIKLVETGFKPRDIIIWDRRREYNNIRPIGYPNKFIANKVHEYIMIYVKTSKV